MTDQHPITPSFGLVNEWVVKLERHNDLEVFTEAARWGANQELEACVEWVTNTRAYGMTPGALRAARRPKPKSLAEEALEELQVMEGAMYSADLGCDFSATRRALERLQELEGQGDG